MESLDCAKPFPECKIGDLLYCCDDLDNGVGSYIIIAQDAHGRCNVIFVSDELSTESKAWIRIADERYFCTPLEALRYSAVEDIKYHSPRLELARKVLKAAEDGDVTEFLYGVELNSETT